MRSNWGGCAPAAGLPAARLPLLHPGHRHDGRVVWLTSYNWMEVSVWARIDPPAATLPCALGSAAAAAQQQHWKVATICSPSSREPLVGVGRVI